ncbi:MAG: NADH-quinone oxidoreductase subunit N [Acidobacteriota bacterium]|nr:NADH-quinone oxidoreductase subunit N [Blastocatellia bacterium]MDW8412758.1 NADH-quinone oxidoreductase subunit N [Acidobacteriota bacterium]
MMTLLLQTSVLDINYVAIWPMIILSISGIAVLLFGIAKDPVHRDMSMIGIVGFVLAGVATGRLWLPVKTVGQIRAFSNMVIIDHFSLYFFFIFIIIGLLTLLISASFLEAERLPVGEFYSLVMFAVVGMMLMAAAGHLVMIFLGLEIASISTYALAGYRRNDLRSNESAIKYFVLGSAATAFLLYGMALIYGATGSAELEGIRTAIIDNVNAATKQPVHTELLFLGAAMMLVGFSFKVSAVPFHLWTPDVYEGAPSSVTAFMATASKAAAFAAFLRVFVFCFVPGYGQGLHSAWTTSLETIAILTMIAGNIAALTQHNFKRMLAYSSIAHAGYALVGLIADDWQAVAFYLLTYSITNIGAFGLITYLAGRGDRETEIDDLAGLGFNNLGVSIAMLILLLSLAGIPLTAGFMGKFIVFKAAWQKGFHVAVIVAVVTSAVSVYYYLRPMVIMFFRELKVEPKRLPLPTGVLVTVVLSILGTFYLGVMPGRLFQAMENAKVSFVQSR